MSEFSGGVHDASGFDSGSMMDGSGGMDASAMGGPSQSAVWNPGMKGVKFSDMLQGINVTPNFMLAMLFLGFTAWLFVIYWIRHNEPLANQVLGTPQASAPTAVDDRKIVNGAKHALPIRTNHKMGNFYTPDKAIRQKHEEAQLRRKQQEAAFRQHVAMPHSVPHGSHQMHFSAPGASHARVWKEGREHVVVPHPEPMVMAPTVARHQLPNFKSAHPTAHPGYYRASGSHPANRNFYGQSYSNGGHSHYHMPVNSIDGTRLKTVVNR